MLLKLFFIAYCVQLIASNTTQQKKEEDFDIDSSMAEELRTLYTTEGSLWEYLVRNVIRNSHSFPFQANTSNSYYKQMVIWYHLNMHQIDSAYITRFDAIKVGIPRVFDLPSRACRYFYSQDIVYPNNMTLDSHKVNCDLCTCIFNCELETFAETFEPFTWEPISKKKALKKL